VNEATCKAGLAKTLRTLRPDAVVYRHEDQFTAGIPDLSVTAYGCTVWVEVKYNRPGRKGKLTPIQARALTRLRGLLLVYEYTNRRVVLYDYLTGATLLDMKGGRNWPHRKVALAIFGKVGG